MNPTALLTVKDLHVRTSERELLHGLDLTLKSGETVVLMGPNGAGKSTLAGTIAGLPAYHISQGSIHFHNEDITSKPPEVRARAGLLLTWQNPVSLPGVTISNYIRQVRDLYGAQQEHRWEWRRDLLECLSMLGFDPAVAERNFGVGFSGGEKKKLELLQILLFHPKLAILDELDSGLDADAARLVGENLRHYQDETGGSLLIITHTGSILNSLKVDRVHVLAAGQLVTTGNRDLIAHIQTPGYAKWQQ